MRGIGKAFPGVRALEGVDLDLDRGEVLALLGENGAGKSTLIKILGGAETPDAGTIEIDGKPLEVTGPVAAQHAGVNIIYQEFNLVPTMTARENIFLGREPGRAGFLRTSEERRHAQQLLDHIGVRVDPESRCRELSVSQQQAVEIAKALGRDTQVLVMDEPSSALSPREVEKLFSVIRELTAHGIGVIYVSHRLSEIFKIADRVMILRDGVCVLTKPLKELSRAAMIESMVGRSLETEFPKRRVEIGEPRLVVRRLRRVPFLREVSFHVRRGEVLALTGLIGAGRTRTARMVFGADRRDGGTIALDGRPLKIRKPRDAIAAGICLLTEDRKAQGLVLGLTARENFGLPNLRRFSSFGWIDEQEERSRFGGYIEQLKIRLGSPDQRVATLSGGNQQKVVLAKWLERQAEVILFDEPTRGIDVGAKYEIYLLINRLAAEGKAIVMISSELPEVLGMADRILVLHEGRVTGEITDVENATQEQILELAVR